MIFLFRGSVLKTILLFFLGIHSVLFGLSLMEDIFPGDFLAEPKSAKGIAGFPLGLAAEPTEDMDESFDFGMDSTEEPPVADSEKSLEKGTEAKSNGSTGSPETRHVGLSSADKISSTDAKDIAEEAPIGAPSHVPSKATPRQKSSASSEKVLDPKSAHTVIAERFSEIDAKKLTDSDVSGEMIPEDAPVSVALIHNMAYPQAGRALLFLGGSILNGDKFSSSRGGTVGLRYLFSEEWGIEGSAGLYSSKLTSEVDLLREIGAQPVVYNPRNIYKINAVFQPIYGKFSVGQTIQHFRSGFTLGIHSAALNELAVQPSQRYSTYTVNRTRVAGVQGGVFLLLPLNGRFAGQIQAEYFRHQKFRSIDKLTKGDQRELWVFSGHLGFLF